MASKKSALEELGISREEVLQLLKDEARASKTPKVDPYLEELVPVKLFKDGKDYKDDVFVSVNGENCLIQRGKEVMIKRKFALVLEQSNQQDIHTAEIAEGYQNEYKKAQNNLE